MLQNDGDFSPTSSGTYGGMVVGPLDFDVRPGVGVKRFLPYFSKAATAEKVYHVFEDCPVGEEITGHSRAAGVGPGGVEYPKCRQCQAWEDELEQARTRRREELGLSGASGRSTVDPAPPVKGLHYLRDEMLDDMRRGTL